jgi:ribose 5-phosphate isomerase B
MSSSFDLARPVAIGSDHAGFEYKVELVKWLNQKGVQVTDMGVYENKSVDYPDYAHPVANSVEREEAAFGILLCGSANGVCMTANKHQGIRAALCWNSDVAKLVRQHNNANIICLPARFIALELAKSLVDIFMETAFEAGRHATRVGKMACM